MGNYKQKIKDRAKNFKLSSEDLHNLYDLFYMIDNNKLREKGISDWHIKFFKRIEKATMPNIYCKKECENVDN